MSVNVEIEENILCKRLREQCFANGTEKDPKICAVTFWRFAKLYMAFANGPMNFIRSAIFLNAAFTRGVADSGVEFKHDQKNLVAIILQKAKARNKHANLESLTGQVKESLKTLKKECSDTLKHISKHHNRKENREHHEKVFIKEYKALQAKVTEDILKILKTLFDECSKIMGPPPCKFAVIGLGSVARKEATPASEFQYLIMLQDHYSVSNSSIRNYFAWLNVLVHVALINIGETPISSATVKKLDWFRDRYTMPGISSCGIFKWKFLQAEKSKEHINTGFVSNLSELIRILHGQTSEKKSSEECDTDLSHLLIKTCFVTGNEALYKSFAKQMKSNLMLRRKSDKFFVKTLQNRVEKDKKNLEDLSKLYFLHSAKALNYKLILFRSVSAFIASLSLIYGINQSSAFEIIEKLLKQRLITPEASHLLSKAVAISYACQINVHMKHSRRHEDSYEYNLIEHMTEYYHFVGVRAIVELFGTAITLQQVITRIGKEVPNSDFQLRIRKPNSLLWCTILCALHLDGRCMEECKKRRREVSSRGTESHFYRYLQAICFFNLNRPNEALPLFQSTLRILPDPGKERITCYYYMGLCYMKNNDYKLATSFLIAGYRMQTSEAIAEGSEIGLVRFLFQLAICAKRRSHTEEALDYLKRGLEIREAYPVDLKDDHESSWLNETGHCYFQLRNDMKALDCFRQAVAAYKKETKDERTDRKLANLLYNLAACLCENKQFREALQIFEEELHIRLNLANEYRNDIRDCQRSIEHCKRELGVFTTPL